MLFSLDTISMYKSVHRSKLASNNLYQNTIKKLHNIVVILSLASCSYAFASSTDAKICSNDGFCFDFDNSAKIKVTVNLDANQGISQIDFQCASGKCLGKITYAYTVADKNFTFDVSESLKASINDHKSVIYKKITNNGYEFASNEDKGYIYYNKIITTKKGIIELAFAHLKTDMVAQKYVNRLMSSLTITATRTLVKNPGVVVDVHRFSPIASTNAVQNGSNNPNSTDSVKIISALNATIKPVNKFLDLGNNKFGTFDLTDKFYEVIIIDASNQDANSWKRCSYTFERKDYRFNTYFSGKAYSHIGGIGLKDDSNNILWFGKDSTEDCTIESNLRSN